MAKIKYHYDQESCSYKKVELTKKYFFINFFKFTLLAILISSITLRIRDNYFHSENERQLIIENQNLQTQYEIIMQDMVKIENNLNNLIQKDNEVYRAALGSEPLPQAIRSAGTGGIDRYEKLSDLDKNKLIMKISQKADKLKHKLNIQSKSYEEILNLSKKHKNQLACHPSLQPVENKDLRRLSSGFGMRPHPTLGIYKMHYGQDFAVLTGTPVYAPADGRVRKARYSRTAGNIIEINHGKFMTRYAHLSSIKVKPGQKVCRGQLIGKSGATGTFCAGAHLHYEVLELRNGRFKHVDPTDYFFGELTTAQYAEVKRLAKRDIYSMD